MNSDSSKDPNISQAYRAAAQAEPGPQLDARILQAAHDALAKPAPKAARWSWLKLPIATLAVAVLATTVALQWRTAPQAPVWLPVVPRQVRVYRVPDRCLLVDR